MARLRTHGLGFKAKRAGSRVIGSVSRAQGLGFRV